MSIYVLVMPVPKGIDLGGFIIGSWTPMVHELVIEKASPHTLTNPEMIQVINLVRAANAAKAEKSKQN